jgi:transglutaminase-like putative cysteine protease
VGENEHLAPTRFVDSGHPAVVAFAREACGGAEGAKEKASRLFRVVRDRFRYDPYSVSIDPADYRASAVLEKTSAYCVPKAIVLAAAARASGIPARLGFADVRNHLASEKLRERMGTDLFVFHGYVELWIDGRAHKASPAFNAELCARFGVPPLEFDGERDALMHAFDGAGRKYMEYVRDRGLHEDLPFDEMLRAYAATYGPSKPPASRDEAFD